MPANRYDSDNTMWWVNALLRAFLEKITCIEVTIVR